MEPISSIQAFRAVNFLAEWFALKFGSESLLTLSGEMEPCSGHPSGDPALPYVWNELWGALIVHTPDEAASIASTFLEQEGDWGNDDGHRRLATALKRGSNDGDQEVWLAWRWCLDKARQYANPGAWSFASQK